MAITDNLLGAYKLDDNTDYSGNGYDLVETGTLTYNTGLIGNALDFGDNNTSETVATPSGLSIGLSSNWSVSFFWQAPNSASSGLSTVEIVWGTSGSGNNNRMIWIRDEGNNRYVLWNSAFSQSVYSVSISAGTWYHIMVVRNGSTVNCYIDNVSRMSRTVGANTNLTPRIATNRQDDANWDCSGKIDLFYIWDKALDSTERSTLYNSGSGYEIPISSGATNNALFFGAGF